MIIVDRALAEREREGRPVRVGMVGAGFMARGIALQILSATPGMDLVAIANRTPARAEHAFAFAGVPRATAVTGVATLERAVTAGERAVTDDPGLLCAAEGIDAILEVTGSIEFAAHVAVGTIEHRKHLVLMNAELDGTVGPLLTALAAETGVVYTDCDGDQPGVQANLYRFVQGIGARPVMCGNIKGLHDPYRNPTTQEGFARQWKPDPHMVTSLADGAKISFEQAIVANATGMSVLRRGMLGPTVETGVLIEEAVMAFPAESLLAGPGVVDHVVGASPAPGVFVLGTHVHREQQHYLHLYKLGKGPLYCFSRPYHLCHFEVPGTIARALLLGDATIAPAGAPQVDVVAGAKVPLRAGEVIDRIGGYMTYASARPSRSPPPRVCCRSASRRGAACATTSRRIACSPTPTSRCRRAASATGSATAKRSASPSPPSRGRRVIVPPAKVR